MVRERSDTVHRRRVRWLEAGPERSSDVLVWLHAFPLSAEMWRPQLEEPPPHWRVIAPDLAGFGGTDDHAEAPSIDDFAADLEALLSMLTIPRAVVGGLSMGGYAAFAMMRRHPGRVRALILADTRSGADSPEARANRARMLSLVREKGAGGVADEMLPKLVGPTTHRTRPEVAWLVRRLIEAQPPDGIARAIERLRDRPDTTAGLPAIAVPTLVMVGAEDAITPPAEARALAEGIAGTAHVIIPLAGHLSSLENPVAFATAVREWLPGV